MFINSASVKQRSWLKRKTGLPKIPLIRNVQASLCCCTSESYGNISPIEFKSSSEMDPEDLNRCLFQKLHVLMGKVLWNKSGLEGMGT